MGDKANEKGMAKLEKTIKELEARLVKLEKAAMKVGKGKKRSEAAVPTEAVTPPQGDSVSDS
jgi:hypothetical protein